MNDENLSKFIEFLVNESYDSDSIDYDVKDMKSSNILLNTNNNNEEDVLSEILVRFCAKRASQGSIYDAGHRFFYWPYYKDIDEEYNVLGVGSGGDQWLEGNEGYSIKYWYIPQKYEDLKQELFYNK